MALRKFLQKDLEENFFPRYLLEKYLGLVFIDEGFWFLMIEWLDLVSRAGSFAYEKVSKVLEYGCIKVGV